MKKINTKMKSKRVTATEAFKEFKETLELIKTKEDLDFHSDNLVSVINKNYYLVRKEPDFKNPKRSLLLEEGEELVIKGKDICIKQSLPRINPYTIFSIDINNKPFIFAVRIGTKNEKFFRKLGFKKLGNVTYYYNIYRPIDCRALPTSKQEINKWVFSVRHYAELQRIDNKKNFNLPNIPIYFLTLKPESNVDLDNIIREANVLSNRTNNKEAKEVTVYLHRPDNLFLKSKEEIIKNQDKRVDSLTLNVVSFNSKEKNAKQLHGYAITFKYLPKTNVQTKKVSKSYVDILKQEHLKKLKKSPKVIRKELERELRELA